MKTYYVNVSEIRKTPKVVIKGIYDNYEDALLGLTDLYNHYVRYKKTNFNYLDKPRGYAYIDTDRVGYYIYISDKL